MKSLIGSALVAALYSTAAGAASPPATIDAYQVFLGAEIRHKGVDQALAADTATFAARFLENPSSPYSDLVESPRFTNAIWWPDYVHRVSADGNDDAVGALAALQLQSGFTKGRPGREVHVTPEAQRAYRSREAAANAIKAGIDPDIFWQAFDMNGASITAAAGYALALQLLREQAAAHDPSDYGRRAIKPDVLSRYLRQTHPERLPESDLRYLSDLLRGAIQRRDAPLEGTLAQRLPAAYRLARAAAAYADSKGYYSSRAYCAGDAPAPGQPTGPEALGFNRPLCFVAATDRGVQAWFRRQLRIEALKLRIHENTHHGFERFVHLLSTVLVLMDMVSFVEIADALVGDELAAEGTIDEDTAERLSDRANRLSCRITR
ncbi:hypothetical protein [Xanthomonas sp. NCPPB 2632]|uniref:hypothetical protein n=1 Tax=Xanthomonas sp. NCPPB 2632 TaxID=3240912 RepID=UPI0035112866